MLNPNSPEESAASEQPETHESFIQLVPPLNFQPNGLNILTDYAKPEMAGEFVLPQNAKSLEFVTANVVAIGKDCKFVEKGDRILFAAKALVNGDKGIVVDGRRLFVTQENLVIGVFKAEVATEKQ